MNDDKLSQLLKEQSHMPGKNPWFTPRLLNKLPARQRSTRWVNVLITIVSAIGCIAAWIMLLKHNDFSTITVRDLIYLVTLLAVSGVVAWQVLKGLVLADE